MSSAGVVVVGASLAGATAAFRLRKLGYEGELTLVGAESHLPYERPALSKGYLAGDVSYEQLLIHPQHTYDELGITLQLGAPARGLDLDRRRVLVPGGDLPFAHVVVATGSRNVRPPIPGIDMSGVHQLRTADDADALRAAAASAAAAVVVGMGFIGCEIAATLRGRGLAVTAVDALPGPLWTVLGPELSERLRNWHEERGVQVLGGVGVAAIEGGDERVERVRLADGRLLRADLVVVGVGARPASEWLDEVPVHRAAGGLGVDDAGRTSVEGVFAIGDVAARWDTDAGVHRRAEHYSSALAQADAVAHALTGRALPERTPDWFWSDQYDHTLQYAGRHEPGDRLVRREDPMAGFFLRGDVVTAVIAIDNGRDLRRGMRLLGSHVDPYRLADPATDLRTVA